MRKLVVLICCGIGLTFSGSFDIILTNSSDIYFADFTAPPGHHINSFYSYTSGGWLYLAARASDGSDGDVITTTLNDIWFTTDWTAPQDVYIKGFDSYVSGGYLWLDALLSNGGDQSIVLTQNSGIYFGDYEVPTDWLKALTSSSGGGWLYLTAETDLNQIGVEEFNTGKSNSILSLAIFPNPARGNVRIIYSLSSPCPVTVKIYDAAGNLVESLVDMSRSANYGEIPWNTLKLASGVYFCCLETPYATKTEQIVIMK